VTRVLLAALLALAAAAPAAAQDGRSRCSAAKLKAVGAFHAALARCGAKAVAKDQSPDPLCLTKARLKLVGRFERAERRGDCRTWREAGALQDLLEDGFADLLQILEPPPSSCCSTPDACFWVTDAADCAANGGTLGEAGTVCSVGACTSPPAEESPCCEGFSLPGAPDATCAAGPTLSPVGCGNLGGTFVDDAVCLPGRVCVD
jgi:hypothetical protein